MCVNVCVGLWVALGASDRLAQGCQSTLSSQQPHTICGAHSLTLCSLCLSYQFSPQHRALAAVYSNDKVMQTSPFDQQETQKIINEDGTSALFQTFTNTCQRALINSFSFENHHLSSRHRIYLYIYKSPGLQTPEETM